jgi:Acyltransferase family
MKQRLAYLDNMKMLLVVGVIGVHSSVTYGFDGTWYLESCDEMASGVVDALTVVIVIGWLFGLGLFFLIAGRLSGPSLDRKGPGRFARERLLRRGAPVLAYTLLVSPALEYFDYRENEGGRGGFWSFFGIRSGTSAPARCGSWRRCWPSHWAMRCCVPCARRRERPHERRCGAGTWRASWPRSPSARLRRTSSTQSGASGSTCSSGCSRST